MWKDSYMPRSLNARNILAFLLHTFALSSLLGTFIICNGTSSDIYCLRSIKESLEDPFNHLSSSWHFNNTTEGFICKFTGIDCWHPDENKVLNIRLSDMGLKGQFPRGIKNCTSLAGLDFSSNNLSGPIPFHIAKMLPFVTSLDLSSNYFSGEIPSSIANCMYLNVLKLDNNRLTGQIPPKLGQLNRIKAFSVADNLLSGPVPMFAKASVTPENYANNPGLCGIPLDACKGAPKLTEDHAFFISGFMVGYAVSINLWLFLLLCCFVRPGCLKRR